jgi:hypothetical protein
MSGARRATIPENGALPMRRAGPPAGARARAHAAHGLRLGPDRTMDTGNLSP